MIICFNFYLFYDSASASLFWTHKNEKNKNSFTSFIESECIKHFIPNKTFVQYRGQLHGTLR